MKPIKIFTFPALRTFNRFVKYFNYKTDNSLPILELPEQVGNGNILSLDIFNDISINFLDGMIKRETILEFKNSSNFTILHFIYNYINPLFLKCGCDEPWKEVDQFQHAIVAQSFNENCQVKLKTNKLYCSYVISISKAAYLNNRNYCSQRIAGDLKTIFEEKGGNSDFFHNGSYNLEIADVIKRIDISKLGSFEHFIFLEAQVHELINQHLIQFKKDVRNAGKLQSLSAYEVEAIHQATIFIENHLAEIKTVSQVARQVGLNNNKLQQGFNELFNLSVKKFIQSTRMKVAKDLLLNSEESISQIVYIIGLNSTSYFSKLFKEHYEVSPSTFRIKKFPKD